MRFHKEWFATSYKKNLQLFSQIIAHKSERKKSESQIYNQVPHLLSAFPTPRTISQVWNSQNPAGKVCTLLGQSDAPTAGRPEGRNPDVQLHLHPLTHPVPFISV